MHRLELFRKHRLGTATQSSAQSFVKSSSGSCYTGVETKSPKTLRLGQYYVQFGKRSEKRTPKTRDCERLELSGEGCKIELPSYPSEISSQGLHTTISEDCIAELPAHDFEEIPTYDSTMSSYEPVYELENKTLDGFESQYPPCQKQDTPPMRRMVHRSLPTVSTSIPNSSVRVDEVEITTPSLISGNNSQIPSPISPVTPRSAIAQSAGLHQEHTVSPISTIAASGQSLVSSSECFLVDEYAYNYDHDDLPNSTRELSFMPPPYQPTSHNMSILRDDDLSTYHDSCYQPNMDLPVSSPSIYRQFEYEPPLAGPSRMHDEPQWETRRSYMSDMDEITHQSLWYLSQPQPPPTLRQFPVSYASVTLANELPLSGDSYPQDLAVSQVYSSAMVCRRGAIKGRETQVPHPPAKRCDLCGAEFTGQ